VSLSFSDTSIPAAEEGRNSRGSSISASTPNSRVTGACMPGPVASKASRRSGLLAGGTPPSAGVSEERSKRKMALSVSD